MVWAIVIGDNSYVLVSKNNTKTIFYSWAGYFNSLRSSGFKLPIFVDHSGYRSDIDQTDNPQRHNIHCLDTNDGHTMATPQAPDMLECPHCGRSFHRKGLPTHKKACKSKHDLAEDQALFLAEKRSRRQGRWTTWPGRRVSLLTQSTFQTQMSLHRMGQKVTPVAHHR